MSKIFFISLCFASFAYADEGMVGTCNVYCQDVRAKIRAGANYDAFRVMCENRLSGIPLANPTEGGLICIADASRTYSGIIGYGTCRTPAAIRRYLSSCASAAQSWAYGKNIGDCYTQKAYAVGEFECRELAP